uniref:Uncharacterized protein n=1 Tax=Bosea sp. NBC_00436 TaxID=2969620 RepID=A0A9E8CQM3_9HYPH
MIAVLIGIGNLMIGIAYAGLGLLSAWETISLHHYRGWSRFGIGFALMAASCGPHHLMHGWQLLQGEAVSWPIIAVTIIGLPPGLIFVGLRFETAWNGQGDRGIPASPQRAILLSAAFAMVAGGLAAWSLARLPAAELPFQILCSSSEIPGIAGSGFSFVSPSFLANLFVTGTYGMVGWYLADRQVRRYLTDGSWSLAGIAMSGVFMTCALMHLVAAAACETGWALTFDLIGVPASIYFLWIVRQLHRDAVTDWNRRPLIGAATAPARASPWSGANARPGSPVRD